MQATTVQYLTHRELARAMERARAERSSFIHGLVARAWQAMLRLVANGLDGLRTEARPMTNLVRL